MSKLTGCGMKA